MSKKWSIFEREKHFRVLHKMYVIENRSLREISIILDVPQSTIYKRLKILGISLQRNLKKKVNNRREEIIIPPYSVKLAEFIGIMLGDGNLTNNQIKVTLGDKEYRYVQYVRFLIQDLFSITVKVCQTHKKYWVVYFGSVQISQWLQKEGLVRNKVKSQVDVPVWIFGNKEYIKAFIRGFFDTDGSVYLLKFGVQIALINYSLPLLVSLQKMLNILEYHPSKISCNKIYLTKRKDISRFFKEIKPGNQKHIKRYKRFSR